jgi:Tfp pilus assembly protein PilF
MKFCIGMTRKTKVLLMSVLISTLSLNAQASTLDEAIYAQQQQWAHANYQLEGDAQEEAFEKLLLEVKEAKKDLEKALTLDGQALSGSAYASLGVLYHKVPGWPIGFGNDEKAGSFMKKALEIDPNGKESNFSYGEFLFDERKYQSAKTHLQAAYDAPQQKNRLIAYKYRQKEISAVLEKVEERLAKQAKRRNRR